LDFSLIDSYRDAVNRDFSLRSHQERLQSGDLRVEELLPNHLGNDQKTPKTLIQFWDNNPPKEIKKLIRHNRKIAKKSGLKYILFNERKARKYLKRTYHDEALSFFDAAPHPAMKADIFRIVYLLDTGGIYLDADMALRKPITLGNLPLPVLFQRTHKPARNILNWFLLAPPRCRLFERILDQMLGNLRKVEKFSDGTIPHKKILSLTGPLLVTKCVSQHILSDAFHSRDFIILDHEPLTSLVMPGPNLLKRKLEYKKTEKHWQNR